MSEVRLPAIPRRRGGRRRDRHGRGPRGPLIPPTLPGWRTRAEEFDDTVLAVVQRLEKRWAGALDAVEFAVEDVPPSDPSPWEHSAVALGRYFPADSAAGLTHRVVIYRRPVQSRCADAAETRALVRDVVVEQVAQVLGREPEEVDRDYGLEP
ncbi:metallopeptidase family protein [Georgenia faecalis]|uniref:Metallopeptidase family protein n=1 Tax=Georgenia faecalis TaxID=2483799 RepID=A0ABV9DCR6_9MICO|nr:metallopeptidase family protein [Georgenia faecalis]